MERIKKRIRQLKTEIEIKALKITRLKQIERQNVQDKREATLASKIEIIKIKE